MSNASASPLLTMTETTPTVLWNDSADPQELSQAIGWGAVGATCNPVIALTALKADRPTWAARITEYAAAHPAATEDEIGWAMVKQLSVDAAALLVPAFERYSGVNGSAYLIGGLGFTALNNEEVVVIPVRSGLGARIGLSLSYLKFTQDSTWNPF